MHDSSFLIARSIVRHFFNKQDNRIPFQVIGLTHPQWHLYTRSDFFTLVLDALWITLLFFLLVDIWHGKPGKNLGCDQVAEFSYETTDLLEIRRRLSN
jgi:hypothetical protein